MAYPIPNGKTQFSDAAGASISSGVVYHYIPGTSTFKDTFQDSAATILNTNPISLDAAGEAVIFGSGSYRQVVFDRLGNQLWDQVTKTPSLSDIGAVPLDGSIAMSGSLLTPGIAVTAAVVGTANAIGVEIDLNNNVGERGAALGAPGLVAPVGYGLFLSGTGAYRSTAALGIAGPGSTIWNRGIVFSSNSIAQASIQDLGSDAISYEIQGSHTYGIDMKAAAFSGAAIRLGNSHSIKFRNVADSTEYVALSTTSTNQLVLGDASIPGVYVSASFSPAVSTALSCGTLTLPWSAVYAAKIISSFLQSSPSYVSDAAAAAGGVTLGEFYRNGSAIQVRIT